MRRKRTLQSLGLFPTAAIRFERGDVGLRAHFADILLCGESRLPGWLNSYSGHLLHGIEVTACFVHSLLTISL